MDIRKRLLDSQEKLNAVVTIIDKKDSVEGPLKDIPIALKDNYSTKGVLTTGCSKILDNYVPVFDGTVVEKLKEAGADLVCKTNMDELAMGGTGMNSYFGLVHNPYDYERISGGSSSGSAALVGGRILDFALGTDTGDSVRKPAAFCGCVGFKPTYGLISRYGIMPYASSLDHVGLLTRSVYQCGQLLNVLAGRDDKDLTSLNTEKVDYTNLGTDLKGKVFGVIDEIISSKTDDDYKKMYLDFLGKLEEKGAIIKHFSMDSALLKTIFTAYHLIANCEATANHANLDGIRFGHRVEGDSLFETMTKSRTRGFGSLLKRRFIIGAYGLDDKHQDELFRKAQKVRRIVVDAYREILNSCDVVLLPSTDSIAPKIVDIKNGSGDEEKDPINNHLILDNFAGNPSISIPFGHIDNCPVGLNLSAKALDELNLLSISKEVEDLINFEEMDKEVNPWTIS